MTKTKHKKVDTIMGDVKQGKKITKRVTIDEVIESISKRKCLQCGQNIDITNFHIPLCRKCRKIYLDKLLEEETRQDVELEEELKK